MRSNKEDDPVEVFEGTTWQVAMVKSLLENAEIEPFIKDEILGTLNPWWTSPGGAGPISVFVSGIDYEKAKQIVDEYEKHLNEKNNS